jgi:hypothetical protein
MNVRSLTCDEFDALLPDLMEDALDQTARANAEAHMAECARCRGLFVDLHEIRSDAARLPELKPSHDLWDGIAARIEPPVVALQPANAAWWQRPSRLAAAAVLLIAATATVTWNVARLNTAPPADSVQLESVDAGDISITPVSRVEAAYDPEIAELRAILAQRPRALDTATARVLDENLRIIDDAIARSRAALASAPANAFLAQQLARAYDKKLHTLRRIVSMPTE